MIRKEHSFLVFSLRGDGLERLSKIENNEVDNPRFSTIPKLARAFGVVLSEIIDGV